MNRHLFSPEEAKARYASLPPEVRSLIYSAEMLMLIRQIAQKYQLHIDQVGALEDETNALMLGFASIEEYPDILTDVLHIEKDTANNIAQDINNLLLEKIRDTMKKFYEEHKTSAPIVAQVPIPPPSTPTPPSTVPPTPPKPIAPLADVLPKTPMPAPIAVPTTPAPLPAKAFTPPPPVPLASNHPADVMLNEKTVQVAPPPKPPTPENYKKDPYREPVE